MSLPREMYRALQSILGAEYVSEDPTVTNTYIRGGYAKDSIPERGNIPPAAVVLPGSTAEVQQIVKLCNRYKVPFVPLSTFWFQGLRPLRQERRVH